MAYTSCQRLSEGHQSDNLKHVNSQTAPQKMFSHPRATIRPLVIDQLEGRILEFKAAKAADRDQSIMLVYGQHASLERIFGIAEYMSQFGRVIVPDLPGFGGMTPFWRVQQKPSLENYARYLGQVIDQEIGPDQSLKIMAMSFGFWATTRLLQIEPRFVPRVRVMVSLVGFVNGRAMCFSRRLRSLYLTLGCLSRRQPGTWILEWVWLNPRMLRFLHERTGLWRAKFKAVEPRDRAAMIDFELNLWRINDTKTWVASCLQMITGSLLGQPPIKTPLIHVAVKGDQYIDPQQNQSDLEVVYNKVEIVTVTATAHAPPVIARADQFAQFVPADLNDRFRRF